MSTRSVLVICAFAGTVAIFAAAPASPPASPSGLAGVWSSEVDANSSIAGAGITIEERAGTWAAARGAQSAASVAASDVLKFAFPDGGELWAVTRGGAFAGQWIQPPSSGDSWRTVSPVELAKAQDGTWHGDIHPLAAMQHFYLVVQPDQSGSMRAWIKNPEANIGAYVGTRSVIVDGRNVRLHADGAKDVAGEFDAAGGTLKLNFDSSPNQLTFKKLTDVDASAFYARHGETNYEYRAPVSNGDGWATGTLRDAGIDERLIAGLMNTILGDRAQTISSPYIQGVAIARHGKLVLDEYFYGFDADRPHDMRSAGKSVTTLLVGAAIDDGARVTPATRVTELLSRYAPIANEDVRKRRMTVADLMTMSSGLACDDNDDRSPGLEDTMQSQTAQPDWYKFTLDLPMVSDPGTKAAYCSAGINLLGGVVTAATGRWLPDYFYERFAKPMQFRQYALQLTPPPLNTAYMGGGEYVLPRDFLKFGQLFLDGGRWNGKQIVDKSWLDASATPRSALNGPGDYGYGWHLSAQTVNGRTFRVINAGGNGGQLLFVLPDLDMTVMITAGNYGQYRVWSRFVTDVLPKYLIASTLPPQ